MYRRRKKMAERKWTVLWVVLFVAVTAIFAGTEVWATPSATCLFEQNKDLPPGQCVNLAGYDVRAKRGLFPKFTNGNSAFKWAIVPFNATRNLSQFDIKIPAAIGSYSDLNKMSAITVSIIKPPTINACQEDDDDKDDHYVNCSNLPLKTGSGTNPGWYLYNAGQGDPATGLGKGEFDYMVLKVIPPANCPITKTSGAKIKVVFNNRQLFGGLGTFLVKTSDQAEGLNLLGPSPSSQSASPTDQPAIRSGESFTLGTTGCTMHLTFNSDGSIGTAVVLPTDPNNGPGVCGDGTPLPTEKISKTWICDNDNGTPTNCKSKQSVEQSIMEEDQGTCTYKYTTKTGQTVTKTISGTAACP
jgi:hypothetical protein